MKRLPGVVFAAVVLLLGSLLQLLMAVLMVFVGVIEKSQVHSGLQTGASSSAPIPPWMPIFMWVACGIFAALAAWGILTSVGLFKVRRWARYSTLIIGGCLAVFCSLQMVVSLILIAVPFPSPANVDPSQTATMHAITKLMFGAMAVLYGIVAGVGISWLVYFNLKKVRDLFATGMGEAVPSARPLLISVIAVFLMIGGPCCFLMAFIPLPGAFLGLVLHGWGKAVFYLSYAVVLTAGGIGLWRLQEWARRLALLMQGFGVVHTTLYAVRPSLMTKYSAEINGMMGVTQPQLPPQFQSVMYVLMFGSSALLLFAIIIALHHYRGAFRPPVEPTQTDLPVAT